MLRSLLLYALILYKHMAATDLHMKSCGQVLVDGIDERRRAFEKMTMSSRLSHCSSSGSEHLQVVRRWKKKEQAPSFSVGTMAKAMGYRWSSASKAVRVMMPPSRWDFRWA